jgi:hypothetical protein
MKDLQARQLVIESIEKLTEAARLILELEKKLQALDAAAEKRHACLNCRPCPCTETD